MYNMHTGTQVNAAEVLCARLIITFLFAEIKVWRKNKALGLTPLSFAMVNLLFNVAGWIYLQKIILTGTTMN